MKRSSIALATLAVVAGSLTGPAALAQSRSRDGDEDKKDNTGAIVAGIAALGIGLAIGASKHGDKHKHDSQWDGNLYGEPFSPATNVICMPMQRKCYYNGYFSYPWTERIFGTSGGFGGSGGSWNGNQDLNLARRVCVDRGEQRGLRNIRVEAVRPEGSNRAPVWMETRRSPMTVNTERWRCEYRFQSGRTEFKRL